MVVSLYSIIVIKDFFNTVFIQHNAIPLYLVGAQRCIRDLRVMVAGCRISTFVVRWVSPTPPDMTPVTGLRTEPDLLAAASYIRIRRYTQSDALLLPAHKVSPTGLGDIRVSLRNR